MAAGFGSIQTGTTTTKKAKPRVIAACFHGQSAIDDMCPAGLVCTKLDGITPKCPALDPEINCLECGGKYTIRATISPEELRKRSLDKGIGGGW